MTIFSNRLKSTLNFSYTLSVPWWYLWLTPYQQEARFVAIICPLFFIYPYNQKMKTQTWAVGTEGLGEELGKRGHIFREQSSRKGQELFPPLRLIEFLIYIISIILNMALYVSIYVSNELKSLVHIFAVSLFCSQWEGRRLATV